MEFVTSFNTLCIHSGYWYINVCTSRGNKLEILINISHLGGYIEATKLVGFPAFVEKLLRSDQPISYVIRRGVTSKRTKIGQPLTEEGGRSHRKKK